MRFEHAKEEVKKDWKKVYDESKDGKGIICPLCGHGANGDGVIENKKLKGTNVLKCFGCDFSGDVISLIQKDTGLGFVDAVYYGAEKAGVFIDETMEEIKNPTRKEGSSMKKEMKEENINEYLKRCAKNIGEKPAIDYLKSRGISVETAESMGIGYDEEADPSGKGYKEPRLIIPVVNDNFYIARRIHSKGDKYDKMNNSGSNADIFNKKALYSGVDNIFVVEGCFDALSVVEVGGEAIALNSAANAKILIDNLEKNPTKSTLILALDNDEAGRKATKEIAEGLRRLNISYIVANISTDKKDPNEALIKNRLEFESSVNIAIKRTAKKPDDVGMYIDRIMAEEIDKFKKAKKLKTGFANLDEKDKANGLYPGLYSIAAISSLGKTTLSHQMADNIAASGNDVLFFSLEQSRLELVTKSLARITAKLNRKNAVTSLEIREGNFNDTVLEAADIYQKEVGGKLSIIEGNFNCDIGYIGEYVRRYIDKNGGKGECRPVVILDYLQVVQPDSEKKSNQKRESIDTTVTELKRISRENDITVIIISSVNRTNYLTPIDFESIKESGGIEYTCDVVWGLQLQVLNNEIFNKKDHIKEKRDLIKAGKKANPRKIELVCLKNRYGISNYSCYFDYYPQYDLFVPGEKETIYNG